ncbi:MAG: HipA family kinase [Candidatus Dormibacteria bacterium]
MRTVTATRYVTPLREGGSLPGLVEADDDGMYVVKFRGAGQGPRALVAELLAGELARALHLPVPELVLVNLDPRIATAEPDQEVQDLLRASAGLNLGMDFLPGALAHTAVDMVAPALASGIVWFDALVMNVDRTARNPNLLRWHREPWMIDHGAAFYRHHGAADPGWDRQAVADDPFDLVAEHVLLQQARSIGAADEALASMVTDALLDRLAVLVPREWADPEPYIAFLRDRVGGRRAFVKRAIYAAA